MLPLAFDTPFCVHSRRSHPGVSLLASAWRLCCMSACRAVQADTAPELLSFSKYLVAIFWIGLIVAGWYVGEELLKVWRSRQAASKAREKAIAAKLAAEDAERDQQADGDEPGSPGGQSASPPARARQGAKRASQEDELDDDDDADSKASEEKR